MYFPIKYIKCTLSDNENQFINNNTIKVIDILHFYDYVVLIKEQCLNMTPL